jgi:endonuclease G
METLMSERRQQQDALAAARVSERQSQREKNRTTLLQPGGLALADEPARVASRIDRLSRYRSDVRPLVPEDMLRGDPGALLAAGEVLERVIGSRDFMDVRYLEAGTVAARRVARVDIRDDRGRVVGYGTGSLVSSQLLLTNHHVLPDADTARYSRVELNYQDGLDGRPLRPLVFDLDPTRFFLADETLDFALVALRATPQQLAPFGFNRLIQAEGKAIIGDFVTIVQHPRGEKKQVALRDNQVVDVLDRFLHYRTDTEPGSSGSPVFNDQWELVALHHASVPDPGQAGGVVNEGIRVSSLLRFVRERSPSGQSPLADQLFAESAPVGQVDRATPDGAAVSVDATPILVGSDAAVSPPPVRAGDRVARFAVPIEVRIGGAEPVELGSAAVSDEAVHIDPAYQNRRGYQADFLGAGARVAPLPTLTPALLPKAAINRRATSDPKYVLPYHHFSVIMNRVRRLAIVTAVNIDGASSFRIKREPDQWFFDPRLPREEQTGDAVYQNNPLDRGHLVRRLDPAWGASQAAAKICNDDTFHFTNCTPQHKDFNENATTWAGLEDYILDHADNLNFKVSVFTGPILADDDDTYRGVQLPRQFWKVAVMVKTGGKLSATAYLLSQEQLIKGLELVTEAFSYGAYRTYQVPVRRIEQLTGLSFGSLADADPLAQREALTTEVHEITRPSEIQI